MADNNTYNSNTNFSNCSESAYGKVVINIKYLPQARCAPHWLCVHIFKTLKAPLTVKSVWWKRFVEKCVLSLE